MTATNTNRIAQAFAAYKQIARQNRPDWDQFIADAQADPAGIAYEVADTYCEKFDEPADDCIDEIFAVVIPWVVAL